MMKQVRFLLFALPLLTLAVSVLGQDAESKILLTIGNRQVSQAEFERIYTKNNQNPAYDSASLSEYMDLFVNYKLKVIEAEALGLDTLKSFISELSGYRSQLEKPYFSDNSTDEALFQEAYDRMQWDIRASHILIMCNDDALPADTLKAYKKIEAIRKRALKGEDFEKLAKENSEDKSVSRNGGDLGYFTAFSMVYPFESGAYNTQVGKISEIVRTRFGYHIIKVVDKRPSQGQVKVAHLMVGVPKGTSPEKEKELEVKINAISDSLTHGADWNTMVSRYSDDQGTAQKGGELPYFTAGRMIPEFEKTAFELKELGSIAKPIRTSYGWHIIKLIDKKPIGTYDEVKASIKEKVSKDVRSSLGKQNVLARLKKEYKFTSFPEALKPFYTLIDSTIIAGEWDQTKAKDLNAVMFTIADSLKYTQKDFASFLNKDGLRRQKKPIQIMIDDEYKRFVERSIMRFESQMLPTKYPDFRNLLQEYHDGILLFNLTDQMVWSKATKDTAGLESFYKSNKNNYMWGNRIEVATYQLNNVNWKPKSEKMILKTFKKKLDPEKELAAFIKNTKDTAFAMDVTIKKFSKGDDAQIDSLTWVAGTLSSTEKGGRIIIYYVIRPVDPEPKLLEESKGIITADYQNYLEKQWIESLKAKYKIELNKDVFKSMIK
jgi:peptidyl-prolyl cis-trans isomerase SurA